MNLMIPETALRIAQAAMAAAVDAISYTTRWINPFASPRAIARACAANPIALAIPCHRVVRSKGYRWGIERKRELIRREAMV